MKKRITSIDVARAAGVSQSLVSLALNPASRKKVKPETREHILTVAKQLGYRMNMNARSMKNRRANAIGVISTWDMNSYVFAPIVNGIQSVCFEENFSLTVCSPNKNNSGAYDFKEYFLQNRIDGVVVISYVGLDRSGILEELEKEKIPYTCVIGCRELDNVSAVDVNFYESGVMAAQHLSERGFGRLIYIIKENEDTLNYAEKERCLGCRITAERMGMEFIPYYGFIGSKNKEDYEISAKEFLEFALRKAPSAVVSTSFECYSILKEAVPKGIIVPDELGVISLDNERYAAYLSPPLTAIKQPLSDMGGTAAQILIKKILGDTNCHKIELSPILAIRQST